MSSFEMILNKASGGGLVMLSAFMLAGPFS